MYFGDLFADTCSSSHRGCDTIWNTDVRSLYRDLIAGTLSRDRLQSVCRFLFLVYTAIDPSPLSYGDLPAPVNGDVHAST